MSRRTWTVAGALGVLGVAGGGIVAMADAPNDANLDGVSLAGQNADQSAAERSGTAVSQIRATSGLAKAEPGNVSFSAPSLTSPMSPDSPNTPPTPNSPPSPVSPPSPNTPPSPDTPPSPPSPDTPPSPPSPASPPSADSPDSPDSPPSADSGD